jgi:hypothetical protein
MTPQTMWIISVNINKYKPYFLNLNNNNATNSSYITNIFKTKYLHDISINAVLIVYFHNMKRHHFDILYDRRNYIW